MGGAKRKAADAPNDSDAELSKGMAVLPDRLVKRLQRLAPPAGRDMRPGCVPAQLGSHDQCQQHHWVRLRRICHRYILGGGSRSCHDFAQQVLKISTRYDFERRMLSQLLSPPYVVSPLHVGNDGSFNTCKQLSLF